MVDRTNCTLCTRKFDIGQQVLEIQLVKDVTVKGVVYAKGTHVDICTDCCELPT